MSFHFDHFFSTAKEVIDFFIFDERFRTKDTYDTHHTGAAGYIFRGQSNASWKLMPSCFRQFNTLENFALQPPNHYPNSEPLRRRLGRHLVAEAQAVKAFLEAADSQGISTPINYDSANLALDAVNRLLRNETEADCMDIFPEEHLYRAFALAQHCGVPTRLLDWTESPLVACFFAAFNASKFAKKLPQLDQQIGISFISGISLYTKNSPVTLVQAPRHENLNLLKQKGVFTLVTNSNSFFLNNGFWPSLESFADNSSEFIKDGCIELDRIRLPASEANSLLKFLYDLGISKLSLMPNLHHSAKAFDYKKRLFESD